MLMPHLYNTATIPETPSKFLIATKAPITIPSLSISAVMTFTVSDIMPMMATEAELHADYSIATESHSIQQSPGINVHVRSPTEPSGTRHSGQIDEDMRQADLCPCGSWNPRTVIRLKRIYNF